MRSLLLIAAVAAVAAFSADVQGQIPVRDSVRRIPVTPQHLATAFHSKAARDLLARARLARLEQDSALLSYDAKAYQRVSVGLSFRDNGRDHEFMRDDEAARIQWQRGYGAVVDLLGQRTSVPMSEGANVNDSLPMTVALPIPYFPGRDALWVGGSLTRATVDESQLVHPLAEGSEAYYQYATGDSVSYQLPDGKQIMLVELRAEARQPRWNLIVGSFWFDQATAHLVRAVYRMSVEMDFISYAADEHKRNKDSDGIPLWLRPLISPLRGALEVVTVEYSLFDGRFWLPARQSAEGRVQLSLIHIPGVFEERFVYAQINGEVEVAAVMTTSEPPERLTHDEKSGVVLMDSLRKRQRDICRNPQARFVRRQVMFDSTLNVVMRIPCDRLLLTESPDLPPATAIDTGSVFTKREHDELVSTLGFTLQAGWAPQPVSVGWGINQSRYNRVEGFSTGVRLHEDVGRGFAWSLQLRGSMGDRQFSGELGAERSNGRTAYAVNAYRRLASANDWGQPFGFWASLPALLYAGDEAFFYRTWGGEVTRTPNHHGALAWRVFAEDEWNAPVTTRFSLFGGRNDARFVDNVNATPATFTGASARWTPAWGQDGSAWRGSADVRAEAATGTASYGRGALDLTVTRVLFKPVSASITAAGGSSIGALPPQREWFLGGSQTIRGENAGAESGNAFWLAQTAFGADIGGTHQSVFADLGWAGSRTGDWGRSPRPVAGVGFSSSILDGLVRLDIAWGIWPKEQRKTYFSVETRY